MGKGFLKSGLMGLVLYFVHGPVEMEFAFKIAHSSYTRKLRNNIKLTYLKG